MEIKKKAYRINTSKFLEPWFIPETIFYGKRGQVKQQAVNELEGFQNMSGEEITFLNVPIKRAKDFDVFEIDGKEFKREQIEYRKLVDSKNEQFAKLLEENPNSYAYIAKGGYYYRDDYAGYTEQKHEAGIYTLKQAIQECKGIDLTSHMQAIVIDIEEHNGLIKSKIQELKLRLINC